MSIEQRQSWFIFCSLAPPCWPWPQCGIVVANIRSINIFCTWRGASAIICIHQPIVFENVMCYWFILYNTVWSGLTNTAYLYPGMHVLTQKIVPILYITLFIHKNEYNTFNSPGHCHKLTILIFGGAIFSSNVILLRSNWRIEVARIIWMNIWHLSFNKWIGFRD